MTKPRRPHSTALGLLVTLFLAAHCLGAPPTEGLIHWWPDPAEGTDQVTGRKGVRRGFGPTEENPEVRFGYAAGWVELGPGITNRTFTISGWVREAFPQSAPGGHTFLSQDSGLGGSWALQRNYGLQFVHQAALIPYLGGAVGKLSDRWQTFLVRATPHEIDLWLDGVRVVVWPESWPPSNDVGPLCLGNCAIGNSPWDGDVSDLRIYDRILTEGEIQSLASSVRSETKPSPAVSTTRVVRTVALEPGSSSEYSLRHFTTDGGLPNSGIQCLLPGSNGALWLGTQEGVTRFDGRQFVTADATTAGFQIAGTDVRAIAEDRFDTRWVGTFNGLIRQQRDEWRAFTNIGPARLIRRLVSAADGTIWLAGNRDPAPRGRAQLRRFDPVSGRLLIDTPIPGQVHDLQLAPDGVWIATDEPAALWHFREASGMLELLVHVAATAPKINPLTFPPVPEIRVSDDAQSHGLQAEVWQESAGPFQWAQARVGTNGPTWTWTRIATGDWSLVKVSSGAALSDWVPMTTGLLHRVGERWQHLKLGDAAASAEVIALAPNVEGGVWAATSGDGLWLVQPRLVRMLTSEEGWSTEEVGSLRRLRDGRILVAGRQDTLARIDPDSITPAEISPIRYGGCLAAECWDGSVVRTGRSPGIEGFHRDQGTNQESLVFFDGVGWNRNLLDVSQLHVSRDGSVWIVTEKCVYQIPTLTESPSYRRKSNGQTIGLDPSDYSLLLNQLPNRVQLHGLTEASDGALWIGSTGAGLFRIFKGQVENFPDSTLATDDPIVPVGFSSDGTLWLGSEDGLGIFREGRYQWVRSTNGLPESVVCDMEEAEGHVWFAGRRGIHAVRRDDLEAFFAGKTTRVSALSLGRSDGLASTEVQLKSQPAMARTDDGQLWVATARGVAHFHPKEVLSRLRPPPVAVDSLKLDGRPFPLRPGPITLPPGGGRVVEIAFSSLSFVAPERVKFHYRLIGPDGPDDEIIGDTSQGYAVFGHLRPGPHVFTVTARSGNGLVSDPPAMLKFDIEPQFYETTAFYTGVGLVALLSVAGFVFARVRVAERRAAREQERRLVAERTRIARDMHDDLGSGLARLAWKSGGSETPNPEGSGNHSQRIARDLLRSLDEAVWAINPSQDHLEGVVNYLGSWVRDYFTDTSLTLALDLPLSVPERPVPAQWRHHVLMIVREICANAVKHSQANQMSVVVCLAVDPAALSIHLRDNGVGFSSDSDAVHPPEGYGRSTGKRGGNGIRNLRDRAAALDARLQIVSHPGSGTEVTLTIPLPPVA